MSFSDKELQDIEDNPLCRAHEPDLVAEVRRLRSYEEALRLIAEDHPNGYRAALIARNALAQSGAVPCTESMP